MSNQLFDQILAGTPQPLQSQQLMQFQGYCSARNLPLDQLIQASVTLFKVNSDFSYQFLTYIDRHELNKNIYNDYQHQDAKIVIYNNLTGLVLARAARESSKEQVDRLMAQAKRYLNSSEKVRMTVDKSIILNRAFLHYYAGEITKSMNLVTRIYEEIQKTGEGKHLLLTSMLMLAQIYFIKKNYHKSLQLYKKCLQTNKSLPVKARLGMAYSFFYLGKYQMARACFHRIIKLDPSCVQAYIGIAVVHDRGEEPKEYFDYISRAYKANKRHPLVLLHLAEHYLFRRELHKSQKFCQMGLFSLQRYSKFPSIQDLCRNDYQQMKVRFNNILAQVNHINSNYIQAIKYYINASGKGLIHNQIGLAQCYIHPNTQNYVQAIKLLQDCYKNVDSKDQRMLNHSFRLMAYLKSKVPPRSKEEKNAEYYYTEAIRFNRHDFDSKIQFANILSDTSKLKALKLLQEAQKIQINAGNEVKPELQNNIAVLHMENEESDLCEQRLENCLKTIEKWQPQGEEEQTKKEGLQIIVKFNYGVCMQRQSRWYKAKQIYQQILTLNKYHVDSALRLAYVWFRLGSYTKVVQTLQQIDTTCEEYRRILRPDRIVSTKAYLQHLCGSSSEAKETIKTLGKNKDIYTQVLELCINYENIMRKGVELNILKEFLRPNRDFCYKFCREDHHATMAYLLLAIIFLADKKFSKTQAIEYFNNLKQFSADQIPNILYNMGFFLMNYDDYENAILILNLYKEKVGGDPRTDQLIALNYLLDNNLDKAEQYVKRNLLKNPTNLKYKLQYSYILERRSHQYYERGVFKKAEVETRLQELKYSMNTHIYFGKVSISDSIRVIQCPQLRERYKSIYTKVKACGQERKFYIKSYIDSFEKVLKDLAQEEVKRIAQEKRVAANMLNTQREKQLQKLLEDEEESEDQEEKQKRQLQKKKQRVLQLARKRQAQMDDAWNDLKAKDQQMNQEKKSRKRGPRTPAMPGQPARPKKEKAIKEKSEQQEPEYMSQNEHAPSQDDGGSFEQEDQELDSEPRKKHKHDKKKKKHKNKHKHKKRSQEEPGEEEEPEQSVKSEKKKEAPQEEDDEQLLKYML